MTSQSSTIYTIGTALRRAQDADVSVDLLASGQWLVGRVSAMDGHGVVLHGDDDQLSIIRMSSIDAVRVRDGANFEGRPEVEARRDDLYDDPTGEQEAHPMPAAPADRD